MTVYTKDYMKNMLCEGLYRLMLKKSFEKITIKQICDAVGVIRGTFYNHFMDKYEALEYLTKKLFFADFDEVGNDKMLYVHAIETIDQHRSFFERAFSIQGQNSFEDMLQNIFKDIFLQLIQDSTVNFESLPCDDSFLASFYASSFKFIVKDWVSHGYQLNSKVICQRAELLFTHSLKDFLEKED